MSINQEPIAWEEHCAWFADRLRDEACAFYVAAMPEGDFLGQVRFRLDEERAVVSLSLHRRARGKGLAGPILEQACERLFKDRPDLQDVSAYIRRDNEVSLRSFARAGFREQGSSVFNKLEFAIYRLPRPL